MKKNDELKNKAIEASRLCCDLLLGDGPDGWIADHPEQAAALMEMAGMLEGEIRQGLIDHMGTSDQCYMPFVAADGMRRCLLPCQAGGLEMAY